MKWRWHDRGEEHFFHPLEKKRKFERRFLCTQGKKFLQFQKGEENLCYIMLAHPLKEEIMELAEKHNLFNL